MKTADEIKKGLNSPIPVHFHIGDPEPRLTPLAFRDLEFLHTDALALIQQLQEEVSKYEEGYDALTKIIKRLEAERDAAVADLNEAKDCTNCKNECNCKSANYDCKNCNVADCPCKACRYEWRGVQKEG